MEALANIFTGKGGTAKLGIVGILGIVLFSIITESDYEVGGTTAQGGSFSVKPSRAASLETKPVDVKSDDIANTADQEKETNQKAETGCQS